MSDYISYPSIFEQLSNELLLVIFEYLGYYSVYDGFFNLNRRFNSLLASNLLPFNILAFELYSSNDDLFQTRVDFFADRILKLTTNTFGCDHSYNLFRFPNIRILVLKNPPTEQCAQINLHTLPHLKYLRVQKHGWPRRENNIYFNLCDISHLQSIYLEGICFQIRWSEGDSVLHALRSLTITTEEYHDTYLQVLAKCPNLTLLKIIFYFKYEIPLQKHPISHLNLRRLSINLNNDLSSKTLEFMLCNLPNLTHLTVTGCLVDVHYNTLANILTRYTMHLKALTISVKAFYGDNEHIRNCIKQAHPLFIYIRWCYPRCSRGRTVIRISSQKK
jgi:hypothetical protein